MHMGRRFNLLNASLILITALSVGLIVVYKLLSMQFAARQEYNQAVANLLAESCEYAVFTHQHDLLRAQLSKLEDLPGLAYVSIRDAEGNSLATITSPNFAEQSQDYSLRFWRWWLESGGQGFTVIEQPILTKTLSDEDALFLEQDAQPKPIGLVRMEMDLAYFESLVKNALLLSGLVVLVLLGLSMGVSMTVSARITRPLKQLSGAAHEVIEGKVEPVELRSGGPELRELGKAFNLMINWLGDYRTEVQSYQAMLEQQAFYDDLTGLANRTLLKDHLKLAMTQAHRRKTSMALLFLDLDRFKYINDTLGHSFGDLLLKDVANRLRNQLRASDTVARMGGDEFIVILNDLSLDREPAMRDAGRVAEQIGRVLSHPFSLNGHDIHTSFSIGIAFYPHDGEDGEMLTRNADCAMYEAKEQGRNTYRFYDPDMQQRGERRLILENGLKHAIEQNELLLHFQPKVDSRSGKLVGAEALLRWRFKQQWVTPVEFIPLAEETGLILPIGEWVLETALKTLAGWRDGGIVGPDFHVGVNVAPQQFWHPEFAGRTLAILQTCLPDAPGALELELTESCLLRPSGEIKNAFAQMRRAGVRFAVDDFGTGYSSLSYLKQFPLDVLKIDQSFVRDCIDDPSDATIIYAIIAMARGLGLDVIAEGVETTAHVDFLKQAGCDLLQGYWLAKPMPADEFARFCREFPAHPIHSPKPSSLFAGL